MSLRAVPLGFLAVALVAAGARGVVEAVNERGPRGLPLAQALQAPADALWVRLGGGALDIERAALISHYGRGGERWSALVPLRPEGQDVPAPVVLDTRDRSVIEALKELTELRGGPSREWALKKHGHLRAPRTLQGMLRDLTPDERERLRLDHVDPRARALVHDAEPRPLGSLAALLGGLALLGAIAYSVVAERRKGATVPRP